MIVAEGRCTRCDREEARSNSLRIYGILGAGAVGLLLVLAGWRAIAMVRSASPREEPTSAKTNATADPQGGPVVTVYTTAHCPWCKKAKAWLDDHEIAYTERDIEHDPAAAAEMRRLAGGGGVPTIVVDGVVTRGYSAQAFERTFRKR
jgi:glutaredoxin